MATPYVGELGAVGLAKEVTLGTFLAPTRFMPVHLPCNIGSPDIALLLSKGIRSVPDEVYKAQQGAGLLKNGKMKLEVEPENIGEILMGTMGTDTMTETASFVVTTGSNDTIDFNIGGGNLVATIAGGTYVAGQTQADAGSLCALIKNALAAADGAGVYTVSYSRTTQKFTIARSAGTFNLTFLSGPNNAKTIALLIGYTKTDHTGSLSYASDNAVAAAFTHTFTRLAAAQLPTYSLWVNNGLNFPEFAGCMVNKLDLDIKAPDFVVADVDWMGSKYVGGGTSKVLSYSALNPLKFDQAVITVAGAPVYIYKDVKLTIDNKVKVAPVLGGNIYSNVIYTEAFNVKLAATIVVEDSTEWTKFINGTSTTFTIAVTSAQNIQGTVPYSLTLTLSNAYYTAAPLPLANGLIEITFQAQGVYSVGAAQTLSAALVNSIGTSF